MRSLGDSLPRCQVTHMSLPLGLPDLEGRNRCGKGHEVVFSTLSRARQGRWLTVQLADRCRL